MCSQYLNEWNKIHLKVRCKSRIIKWPDSNPSPMLSDATALQLCHNHWPSGNLHCLFSAFTVTSIYQLTGSNPDNFSHKSSMPHRSYLLLDQTKCNMLKNPKPSTAYSRKKKIFYLLRNANLLRILQRIVYHLEPI